MSERCPAWPASTKTRGASALQLRRADQRSACAACMTKGHDGEEQTSAQGGRCCRSDKRLRAEQKVFLRSWPRRNPTLAQPGTNKRVAGAMGDCPPPHCTWWQQQHTTANCSWTREQNAGDLAESSDCQNALEGWQNTSPTPRLTVQHSRNMVKHQ